MSNLINSMMDNRQENLMDDYYNYDDYYDMPDYSALKGGKPEIDNELNTQGRSLTPAEQVSKQIWIVTFSFARIF